MKILVLSTDFKPKAGGIAELAFQLSSELNARHHELQVLTHADLRGGVARTEYPFVVHRDIEEYPLSGVRSPVGLWRVLRWSRRTAAIVRARVRCFRPDVVFATNYHVLWPSVLCSQPTPYCVFLHGEDVAAALASRIPGRARRMAVCVSRARHLFFNSHYSDSLINRLARVPISRRSVVGAGVATCDIVDKPMRDESRRTLHWDDAPVLLTVARLILRKGIDTTLAALPGVLKAFPTCRYVVVGEGPDAAALQSVAAQHGVEDHIAFLGRLDEATKRAVYLASDLYVMPSRPGQNGEVEGFGISFLEANAHGLAVVGSRAGGIPDAVEHGVNGWLVAPENVSELLHAITGLLADPNQRRAMARAGQERIRRCYNWHSIATQVEAALCACMVAPQ